MRYEVAVETERPFPGGAEALAEHLENFVEDSGFLDEWFSVEWSTPPVSSSQVEDIG